MKKSRKKTMFRSNERPGLRSGKGSAEKDQSNLSGATKGGWQLPLALLLGAVFLATPAAAQPVLGILNFLEKAVAQKTKVELVLSGGARLSGRVVKIENQAAQIEKLAGEEYYDAWVAIEDVQAVIWRAREDLQ